MNDSVLRPALRELKETVERQRKMTLQEIAKKALLEIVILHQAIDKITWDEHHAAPNAAEPLPRA